MGRLDVPKHPDHNIAPAVFVNYGRTQQAAQGIHLCGVPERESEVVAGVFHAACIQFGFCAAVVVYVVHLCAVASVMCGPLTGPQPQLQPGRAILNGPQYGVFDCQEGMDGRAVGVVSLRRDAAHSIHMLSGTQTVCDPAAR